MTGRRQPRPGQGAGSASGTATRSPTPSAGSWPSGRGRRSAGPERAWQAAIDGSREVRERRVDGACADRRYAHRADWIEEAHVTELTGLLREGPDGDQLKGWPKVRVFARCERPHPGARLFLFEPADGWRYSLWVTNYRDQGLARPVRLHRRLAPRPRPRRGRHPHREEHGLGHFPSHDYGLNKACPTPP